MAKKNKATQKVTKAKAKRLTDLDIDEVSLVDKPAIGETFVVTKRVNNKEKTVAKKKDTKIQKGVSWKGLVKKNAESCTHCVFCGITKEEEAEALGMGLIKNVCFMCACEHEEKGVFNACIDGSFDVEKFAADFPDIKLVLEPVAKGEGEEDESSSEDDQESGSEDDEAGGEGEGSSEDAGDGAPASTPSEEEVGKKIEEAVAKAVKKSLEDVEETLKQSMQMHETAAYVLNEIVALNMIALDMTMKMREEEESEESEKAVKEVCASISAVQEDIEKAGAKISRSRLDMLKDIVAKLGALIESVGSEKATKKSLTDEVKEAVEAAVNPLHEKLTNALQGLDEKLKGVSEIVDNLEQSGGAGNGIDDGDDEDETPAAKPVGKSVFSSVIGIDDITKSIKNKQRK